MIVNSSLLELVAKEKTYFISTGMSTFEQIENTVEIFKK